MGKRRDLHQIFKNLPEIRDAYFQPPSNEKMVYPCVVYNKDDTYKVHANNNPYMIEYRYQVIAIAKDPESPLFEALEALPKCRFERAYRADQLNHQVFNIYF